MIEIKTITVGSLFVQFCAGVHWSALKKPNFMYPGTWIYKKKYENSTLQCFQSYQKWVKSIRGAL